MILIVALMGGLFAVLTMIHFLIDWLPQSHAVAMTKHNHAWVRAKHCAIYMLGFFPLFWLCSFDWFEFLVAGNIFRWSEPRHFASCVVLIGLSFWWMAIFYFGRIFISIHTILYIYGRNILGNHQRCFSLAKKWELMAISHCFRLMPRRALWSLCKLPWAKY